jgi:hypothetical protein
MNIASIFNYFEAGLWFIIAVAVFIRRDVANPQLTKLALILSASFALFSISDVVEAATGAWWRPLWLLGLKGLCVLSFVCCWIKYRKIVKISEF